MSQRVTVQLLDDIAQLDGKEVDADHGEVEFSIDGRSYCIDLSSAHYKDLRGALDPYIQVARKATNGANRATAAPVYRMA